MTQSQFLIKLRAMDISQEALVGLHWKSGDDHRTVLVAKKPTVVGKGLGGRHMHRQCKTNVISMKLEVRSQLQGWVPRLTRDSGKGLPGEVTET